MTADGRNILREVASDIQNHHYGEIIVTGFTDTVGSVEYNDALAARRASTAAEELRAIAPGIPVYSRSARDLQVPSGPGVREERNRRVMVELYTDAVNRPAPTLSR
jgi:outer membrane protein OmpA-like peptidoglycan-associated protein